jgi:hypothetical protein
VNQQLAADAFAENAHPEIYGQLATSEKPPLCNPFAAENFSNPPTTAESTGDLVIELRTPDTEEFVRVSDDTRHFLIATLLVVNREDGYGKSYFLLTPEMRLWVSNQPSLAKFVKSMRLYLFMNADSEYGLWPIRNAFDNWAISDTQVAEAAKRNWVRRYTAGKVRKAHTSTSIETELLFPDLSMFGADGILAKCFGEAFVIASREHAVIQKLMGS